LLAPRPVFDPSSIPCKFLVDMSHCKIVKCKYLHKLPSSEITIKLLNEPNVSISNNTKILVASYD
jgi:hypothetical protein